MNKTLPPGYKPTNKETFMNERMSEYFRQKLLSWKAELLNMSSDTLSHLQEGGATEADIADRASVETDRSLELRTRDRARKLINKIDEANGDFDLKLVTITTHVSETDKKLYAANLIKLITSLQYAFNIFPHQENS
jgi:RNA polymerase-binding protein DksA